MGNKWVEELPHSTLAGGKGLGLSEPAGQPTVGGLNEHGQSLCVSWGDEVWCGGLVA